MICPLCPHCERNEKRRGQLYFPRHTMRSCGQNNSPTSKSFCTRSIYSRFSIQMILFGVIEEGGLGVCSVRVSAARDAGLLLFAYFFGLCDQPLTRDQKSLCLPQDAYLVPCLMAKITSAFVLSREDNRKMDSRWPPAQTMILSTSEICVVQPQSHNRREALEWYSTKMSPCRLIGSHWQLLKGAVSGCGRQRRAYRYPCYLS